jgi:hypothetical protein
MTVYKVPVTVKKIKTFLKNALVFDMEFYFGHIIMGQRIFLVGKLSFKRIA